MVDSTTLINIWKI